MIIFDPIDVPVPLGTVLTASNVPEDDAAVWAVASWTSRTSAADNTWNAIAYGNGIFVAVASDGAVGTQVMTSPDGITWTSRTSAADVDWAAVTFGNGLFVAVSTSGLTTNRIMTSPDGITWTSRSSNLSLPWRAVAYGNSTYVILGDSAAASLLSSSDGITWTSRTGSSGNDWRGVTFGNGVFVAVSDDGNGTGIRVMTSPDGITWTSRIAAAALQWTAVTFGNGLFVAVSDTGTGNRVMTSPDGITWTSRTSAADYAWTAVTYGNGLFVAVATTGTGNRVMTSPDGITWTLRNSAADNAWRGVAFGNGVFAAVSSTGTGNRVMTFNSAAYTLGQQVIYTPDKHLYEVLAYATGDIPAEGALLVPPTWLDLGPINRWKMFDEAVTLQTSKTVSIDVTIAPGVSVDAVAALNVSGYSVQVIRASTGYNVETVLAGKTDVVFFLPTATSGSIQVIVWGDAAHTGGTAKIGELLIGPQQDLGVTNFGTSIGIIDYSRKETDTFGNLTIVERRFSKRASYNVTVETLDVASIQSALAAIRATPVVYIGDPARPETVVYGFYKSFQIVLSSHSISDCSIEVEGLT